MGEYALFGGREIKIGTCEDMYYLRADHASRVTAKAGNVDPVKDRDEIRFRFPWPDEDNIAPGSYKDPFRSLRLDKVEAPDVVEHGNVQFTAPPGYLLNLPCPEGAQGRALNLTIHRNGFDGGVRLVQQRYHDGRLVIVCECGSCRAKWRIETLVECRPYFEACKRAAQKAREDEGGFWNTIARRIVAGYAGESETGHAPQR